MSYTITKFRDQMQHLFSLIFMGAQRALKRQKLAKELCAHYFTKLPVLMENVRNRHTEALDVLQEIECLENKRGKWPDSKLQELIDNFREELRRQFSGGSGPGLLAGRKLNDLFYTEVYKNLIMELQIDKNAIVIDWTNFSGKIHPDVMHINVLPNRIGNLIPQFERPLHKSTEKCCLSLLVIQAVQQSLKTIENYPNFKRKIVQIMTEEIKKNLIITKKHFTCFLECEKSYVNRYYHEYIYRKNDQEKDETDFEKETEKNQCLTFKVVDEIQKRDKDYMLDGLESPGVLDCDPREVLINHPDLKKVIGQIKAYMTAFHEKTRDSALKIISYLMVDATLHYVNHVLSGDMQTEDKNDLVQISENIVQNKVKYESIYEGADIALDMLDKIQRDINNPQFLEYKNLSAGEEEGEPSPIL